MHQTLQFWPEAHTFYRQPVPNKGVGTTAVNGPQQVYYIWVVLSFVVDKKQISSRLSKEAYPPKSAKWAWDFFEQHTYTDLPNISKPLHLLQDIVSRKSMKATQSLQRESSLPVLGRGFQRRVPHCGYPGWLLTHSGSLLQAQPPTLINQ